MAHHSIRRLLLIVPAAVVLVVIAAGAAAYAWFDPNAYKDRIEAAVERQTGRRLVLAGPLRLTLTPRPALEASDVSFANLPGGSRPEMATARRLQVEIAWLPLLQRRLVVRRLTLINPDLVLERDAGGRPNWQMTRAPADPAPPASPSDPPTRSAPKVELQGFRLVEGTLTWRGARTVVLAVAKLDLDEAAPDAPITVSAAASLAGRPFELSGEFGSLTRLRDETATSPWPARLSFRAGENVVGVDGSFTQPQRLDGYNLTVTAQADDLAAVAALVPGVSLPALRDMKLSAHVAAQKPLPLVSELLLHAGVSDLGATVRGLKLAALDVAIPGPDRPMHATVEGSYENAPLRLAASGGTFAALLPGASGPFPFDVAAEFGGAKLHLQGALARPREAAGLHAALSAEIPDLQVLAPLVPRLLPALSAITLTATVSDLDGLAHGISLEGLHLTLPQGDLAGDLALGLGARPVLRGRLSGTRLDVDALRAAWPPGGGGAPVASAGPAASSPKAGVSQWVIPDTGFAFDVLHRGDADLQLDLGEVVLGGMTTRSVGGHLVLNGARLVLDPATAILPGGAANGRLEIDAGRSPARLALALHSAALELRPLLSVLQVPDEVAGVVQIEADLRGVGDTPHAVAGSVDGMLGVAMVGGSVENRLLTATFGELLRVAKVPGEASRTGRTDVRCFALRLDASHGVAAVRAFLIDVSRLRVSGSGTLDLAREALALRLRPFVRIAGSGLVVPLHVGGTFRKPLPTVDPTGAPEAAAAVAADLAVKGSALTGITSAIAAEGERLLGDADSGNCGPALAAARNGKAGPEPAAAKADKKLPVVDDLLKRLLR